MLINEVAIKTQLSKDTIRYYEKIGLLKLSKKQRRDNNYKEYSQEAIDRLEIIKRAKYLGFSLSEIKEFISSWLSKSLTKEERVNLFEGRILLIDQKIEKLLEIKKHIKVRITEIQNE